MYSKELLEYCDITVKKCIACEFTERLHGNHIIIAKFFYVVWLWFEHILRCDLFINKMKFYYQRKCIIIIVIANIFFSLVEVKQNRNWFLLFIFLMMLTQNFFLLPRPPWTTTSNFSPIRLFFLSVYCLPGYQQLSDEIRDISCVKTT